MAQFRNSCENLDEDEDELDSNRSYSQAPSAISTEV